MPDNKPAVKENPLGLQALVAAADIETPAIQAEKERKANMNMFDRKADTIAKKRAIEKAKRNQASELFGERTTKAAKTPEDAQKLLQKFVAAQEKKFMDIDRRAQADYEGKKPLTRDEARSAKRSIARALRKRLQSETSFSQPEATYTTRDGQTRTVGGGQVGGQKFGEQVFGGDTATLNKAYEYLNERAGKSYSGKVKLDAQGNRIRSFVKDETGRLNYVFPKANVNIGGGGRTKLNPRVKGTAGRKKGSKNKKGTPPSA